MNEKQLFFRFLKEQNLLHTFIHNYNNCWAECMTRDKNIPFNVFLNICLSNSWINKSFSWKKTNEGYHFWGNVDKEWATTLAWFKKSNIVLISKIKDDQARKV